MKLQITYNLANPELALELATSCAQYGDLISVGNLLIYHSGVAAIAQFRKQFPQATIVADAKLCDRAADGVKLLVQAGADVVTVLAGSDQDIIYEACQTAHQLGAKIALDLLDAFSFGQSAMDAEQLGVDIIIFRRPHDGNENEDLFDEWETTRGNTKLPIFFAGNVNRNNINRIINLNPHGIIIGSAITNAQNPALEAGHFASLIPK